MIIMSLICSEDAAHPWLLRFNQFMINQSVWLCSEDGIYFAISLKMWFAYSLREWCYWILQLWCELVAELWLSRWNNIVHLFFLCPLSVFPLSVTQFVYFFFTSPSNFGKPECGCSQTHSVNDNTTQDRNTQKVKKNANFNRTIQNISTFSVETPFSSNRLDR